MECIFCAIAGRQLDADVVSASDDFVAFRDIHPKAPVHLLVIPRKHITSFNDAREEDGGLLGSLLLFAQRVAREQRIAAAGYKIVVNVGRGGGQVVEHLHLHLLGGWTEEPKNFDV